MSRPDDAFEINGGSGDLSRRQRALHLPRGRLRQCRRQQPGLEIPEWPPSPSSTSRSTATSACLQFYGHGHETWDCLASPPVSAFEINGGSVTLHAPLTAAPSPSPAASPTPTARPGLEIQNGAPTEFDFTLNGNLGLLGFTATATNLGLSYFSADTRLRDQRRQSDPERQRQRR